MSYNQPVGVPSAHFKNCASFGRVHRCTPTNYQTCRGCKAAVCPRALRRFSFFKDEPDADEVYCPTCLEKFLAKLASVTGPDTVQSSLPTTQGATSSGLVNSSVVASQDEAGSPPLDTGGTLAPPSPEDRNNISFGSTNSSVAESDGDSTMTQEMAKMTLRDIVKTKMEIEDVDPKRRKKTPPSSGEHDSLAPPVPTGPDAVATKQEDSVMASSSKEEPGTVTPRDTSGDVNMEATNSEPSGPVTSSLLSKVDLDYDYDPNEPNSNQKNQLLLQWKFQECLG